MRLRNKKQKSEALPVQARDQESEASSSLVINHWLFLSDEMVLYILRLLPKKDLGRVSLLNKKFRDLSRDDSLWTELTLDYQDIKQSAESCRKLVERCKKLTSLKITNKSRNPRPLNIMSVVIRAKKSLKVLEIDTLIRSWTDVALEKLGQMKRLQNITATFTDSNYRKGWQQLAKLDQLEVLRVRMRKGMGNSTLYYFVKNDLKQFKTLKEVDLEIGDPSLVAALTSNNPDLVRLRFQCWIGTDPNGCLILKDLGTLRLYQLRSEYPGIDIERTDYHAWVY